MMAAIWMESHEECTLGVTGERRHRGANGKLESLYPGAKQFAARDGPGPTRATHSVASWPWLVNCATRTVAQASGGTA